MFGFASRGTWDFADEMDFFYQPRRTRGTQSVAYTILRLIFERAIQLNNSSLWAMKVYATLCVLRVLRG